MCNEKNNSDDQLKLEDPITYYLENIDDEEIMNQLRWDDPELYNQILRLNYLQSLTNKEPIYQCPICRGNIITDNWGEEYCSVCGLVTRTQYPYVAGQKIHLDYGLK